MTYYPPGDIERICLQELRVVGLLPSKPGPVRIDRFIEKRFGITPDYRRLDPEILGETLFRAGRPVEVVINSALFEEDYLPSERRLRSTLAHEAGHCVLHSSRDVGGGRQVGLFEVAGGDEGRQIRCREESVGVRGRGYSGKAEEWQANAAIGGFLLPESLVYEAIEPYALRGSAAGVPTLNWNVVDEAARTLADVFDVNPVVVGIRFEQIFGAARLGQGVL